MQHAWSGLRAALLATQLALSAASLYLLVLLGAAAWARRRGCPPAEHSSPNTEFRILMPAHDEANGIGLALDALRRCDYPSELVEVVVIADNCTDATAAVARSAGVTVLERSSPDDRGKGPALAWALSVLQGRGTTGAFGFVDADCEVSSNFLRAADLRLRAGDRVLQSAYRVSNPGESPSAGLRSAAFGLVNFVRPLGKSQLGLSAGLLGSGMVMRHDVLETTPWSAFSLTEDLEFHLELLEAGETVRFAPEASVDSKMPLYSRQSREQQVRWEAGRTTAARNWFGRLMSAGARRRDPVLIHAAFELLIPPQSLLALGNGVSVALAVLTRARAWRAALVGSLAQVVFVIGGMALAGVPRTAYRALMHAPGLLRDKLLISAQLASRRGPSRWVRTERA